MTTSLSLYSSKILSEHPLGHWPLQDKADYVSMLSKTKSDLSGWTKVSSDTDVSLVSASDAPMSSESVFKISTHNLGSSSIKTVTVLSDTISDFSQLDSFLSTFTLSTFLYSYAENTQSVSIGFVYDDPTYGTARVSKRFTMPFGNKWVFLSETFDRPYNLSSEFKLFIEIEFLSNNTTDEVSFLVNGLSLGQWSEEFNSTSTGVIPEQVIENIYSLGPNTKAVKLLASAESTKDGYSVCSGTNILGKKTGIPMTYGSEASFQISPNTAGKPSVVIPGLGFLNKSGANRNYTFEAWIKVDHSQDSEFRIIGPVASDDGLYVDGPFLKLRIGDLHTSHYVGEWYRPMLIHIAISKDSVALLVNGEIVGTISISNVSLQFPDEVLDGIEQDWIGIYSNSKMSIFEINAVSIYTYIVSSTIAKRRWIYGQGVENPESLNVAYGGKSIAVDYQFAKYSSNYSYPKIGAWSKGLSNNLATSGDYLKIPSYKSMSIISASATQEAILAEMLNIQNETEKFIKLPENSYGYYENLDILPDGIESLHVVYKTISDTIREETLLELRDKLTGDYLSVKLSGGNIKYSVSILGKASTLIETLAYVRGEQFAVALHLKRMAQYFGNEVALFLSKHKTLSLYIGGTGNNDTFSGKIYSISFSNLYATEKLSEYFAPNGLVWDAESITNATGEYDAGMYSTTFWEFLLDGGNPAQHANSGLVQTSSASYTVSPYADKSTMYLDGFVNGSWTSSIPLSYFGKYSNTQSGKKTYDLDFIQFNISYPSPASSVAITESDAAWSYQDLSLKFATPSQKRYSDLDNHLYTGYVDYTDLQHNTRQAYKFDTSKSIIKTYVFFKDNAIVDNFSSKYYSNIISAPRDGVIQPGSEWVNTKYEVVDNMIIYPPANVKFENINIYTEIIVSVDKISEKPIAINGLELSSVVLDNNTRTPIGTKYGIDIYPFTENGFYYDYKSKNPFSIYKGSTPYLYLTKTSGIKLKGLFNSRQSRGIEIAINQEKVDNYKVIAMQCFAMYDDDFFPYSPTEIFEIVSNNLHLKFYLQATHPDGLRGKIYAINTKTGQVENGIGYYINGNIVKDPVLTIKQWAAIGIGFANYLDCSLIGGALRITGPLMINNISYYNSSRLQQVQRISARPWFSVRESGRIKFDWVDWKGIFRWFEVLVLSSKNFYGVDPSDIYAAYVGSSKITVDDKSILRLFRSKYRVISNSVAQLFTINSV